MSECCQELLTIIEKYNSEDPKFVKSEIEDVVSFVLSWPQRQCRCIFRDQLHLARLEDLLQRLLECAIDLICELRVPAVEDGKKSIPETDDEGERTTDVDPKGTWTQPEKERLFLAVGKIFQLPFPFYQVRKIHLLRQETTSKDCSKYCDVNDGEVPEALLVNVAFFCDKGGLSAIREAFQDADPISLTFPLAHHLINIVTQLRLWFSIQAIMQYIIPLRRPVIRYLCKLTDKDLRQPDGRLMVDSMWSAVKGPVESGPICDKDSLDLAFKYFTSSTLTVRLAGLSQIANQVHMFMDPFQTDPAAEADRQCLCKELSEWLIENKLVEHLFGPNLHVELLKQSQIILNYLARETYLTTSHLDCIWLAAQLKHASRYVHDLLTVLTKHMDMPSILYLLDLVSKLPPNAHTRQTLYLASLLTRIVWRAGLSSAVADACPAAHTTSPVRGPLTSSATSAGVTSVMQRKFGRTASLSQSSSRSGSLSDISCDGEQLDLDESPMPHPQKYTHLSSQGSVEMDTEELPHPSELRQSYHGQTEDYSSQEKTGGEEGDIDSTSCTNSHGSSLSDRRDLDEFDAEGVEDELTQLKTVAALRVMQDEGNERERSLGFDLNTVCDEGKTLLWDLIQDDNAIQLSDGLVQEAEKLLCQLICYTGEKKIRMKFIEGCVTNLAANRSVVMSIQLIPKLFSSFQQFVVSGYGPHWVTNWANRELNMMELFFNNVTNFVETLCKGDDVASNSLYSPIEEVQARLQFLSSVFSCELSQHDFKLSASQVDVLWHCLVTCDSESSDDTLEWFLQQAQSKEFHALDASALQYIFTEKLPSLPPEKFSMTGLHLLQQLYKMFKHSDIKPRESSKLYGIDQLWNIAVQARSTEVSWAAISYLNSLYINANGGGLKFEDEFIGRCMTIIATASKHLSMEQNLQIMERGLLLLKSHIESFKRRFAFHLRLWWLEGRGITCHQQIAQRPTEKHYPIRVICQPAGLTDKGTFEMNSSDLVADLRAEVTFWCKQEELEKKPQFTGDSASQHTPLSPFSPQLHPPFRLLSQGHELTPDLDEKSLAEVGFKDLQLVFVSVGAVRRERHHDSGYVPSSSLPSPNWDSTPMIILLQEQYFGQLFAFLEALDHFVDKTSSTAEKSLGNSCKFSERSVNSAAVEEGVETSRQMESEEKPPLLPLMESRIEFLCGIAWELLFLLPTNQSVLNKLRYVGQGSDSQCEDSSNKGEVDQRTGDENKMDENNNWQSLLDPNFPHKLLYSLQVIDLIHNSSKEAQTPLSPTYSRLSSDSDVSDNEDEKNIVVLQGQGFPWGYQFIELGGLRHLYEILMSGCLEVKGNSQWHQECLAHLLKLICEFGTMKRSNDEDDDVFATSESDTKKLQLQRKDGKFRVRYKSTDKEEVICIKCLSSNLMSTVNVNLLLEKLLHISYEATLPIRGGQSRISGGEVVHHAVSLLVSAAFTDGTVRSLLLQQSNFKPWLQQLVLLAKEPTIRFEACRGLYRLSLIKENSCLIQLMDALLDSLPLAQSLQSKETSHGRRQESGAREYFSILCRLVDGLPTSEGGQKGHDVDLDSLAKLLASYIRSSQPRTKQKYGSHESEGLSGVLKLCTAVMRHDPAFKMSPAGLDFLRDVFHSCLFALPEDCCDERDLPLCKSKLARSAAFDLLLEMARGCKDNYLELQRLLLKHHISDGKRRSYGWHYWPHDNGRSPCGLVGMINLGATCYMASCMQQLYMMPQARAAILNSKVTSDLKHEVLLREIQRMFCFLMASERKAYNPKTFCRTYTMDKQPLNTGEQKDMTEFFTDLIGKIEEMSPSLKVLVRDLFCGEISNNVVSLDCVHVSKTREEFYSVRCTVADMKSLYESLDEVTIKDTLDGDNMYTCSQCGKKVRAEKRACFKVLPRILCFNTMRYAFNMVTMMKEKVNTHFSFPLQLNMAPYTEEFLMGDKQDQDPQRDPSYWYQLIGVVVHTGTAEGGHYYSFIRDRSAPQGHDQWFLFNDAEVKPFDPAQIASECFGGEMTTKTYDAVTEKFMDFSFEKTHSAYMLFYERCDPNQKDMLSEMTSTELNQELADWIWHDNIQFLHDKHVFDTTYFNFMWFICSNIPPSLPESKEVMLSNVKLGTSFLLETLVHAKEKLLIKNWADLLLSQYEQSSLACLWLLETLTSEDWLLQVMVKCPIQNIRHMFARLCLDVIQILRPLYVSHVSEDDDEDDERPHFTYVRGFVKGLFKLLEQNIKAYVKNLPEVFWFIYQFADLGGEEREFLLKMDAISVMVGFYLGTKSSELNESTAEDDDDGDDDDDEEVVTILPEDKYRMGSLEKMISVIAMLVEESRCERHLQLSENDMAALTGGKGFPFLFQSIKDGINLRHTTNLIFSLCRYNVKLAENIICLLMSSVQKLPPEQSHSFFKLLSMLTEMPGGPPGMPSFTNLTLARIWEAAEYNAGLCIDWLTCMAPKNKTAHQWVLNNMDKWVEKYLIADNSIRIRNASAYLLISLVPNSHFRQGFRSRSFSAPHKEMLLNKEALSVLHEIFKTLLNLLPRARKYCDRNIHGTTKLVSYFAVLNYCLVSQTEKEMFTSCCTDLWRLFHPLMSEPNIPVHPNKQALLIFWFHACIDCDENVDFITENNHVATNIPLNYILSSDEPEVVTFNRNVLPAYYGLLRLCCEHSPSFTRQLANHSNMKWAFENLTTRMNQYPQAVEELLTLMRLFAGVASCDATKEKTKEEEAVEATFRRDTIVLYQNCLDGGASWTTLISAYKILLQTEEDRLTVVINQGLLTLSDAFTTLHMMYHEATACHVTGDLTEVLMILHNLLVCCRPHSNKPDVRSSIVGWSERLDIAQKLLSLLNSYTPKEVRTACLEVLNAMLVLYSNDFAETLIPIIHASHQHWNKTSPPGLLGPYFPRRHTKVIVSSKSVARPAIPELNMFLHPSFLDSPKGVEESYDAAVMEYFQPYHSFVDKLLRFGFNQDRVPDHVIACSCLLGVEAISLHFTYFSKLWMEVYQKAGDSAKYKSCMQKLCQQPEFLEYVDLILLDERESLNVREIYTFLCCFFPRVSNQVLVNQWNNLVQTLVATVVADKPVAEKASDSELCVVAERLTAELRAMSLLFSVRPPEKSHISSLLHPSLENLLAVCRKYQEKKCDSVKAIRSGESERQQQDKDKAKTIKGETGEEPLKKRRRTLEGEEQKDSKVESVGTEIPGTSKDDTAVSEKKEKTQGGVQKQSQKTGSLWGSKPSVDWVDSLVKAIQSTITKVPV